MAGGKSPLLSSLVAPLPHLHRQAESATCELSNSMPHITPGQRCEGVCTSPVLLPSVPPPIPGWGHGYRRFPGHTPGGGRKTASYPRPHSMRWSWDVVTQPNSSASRVSPGDCRRLFSGGSEVEGTPSTPPPRGWWGLEAEPQLPAPTQEMTACAGVELTLKTSTRHLEIR